MDLQDFEYVVEELERTKGRLGDAQMTNAKAYQDLEENYGLHRAAIKVFLKLKRMDTSKRNDWLRAFDEYRKLGNLDAQGDMVDEAGDEGGDGAQEDGQTDIEDFIDQGEPLHHEEGDGAPAELDLTDPQPVAADAEDGAQASDADWSTGAAAGEEDSAGLDQGGTAYNDGMAAAEAGKSRDDNPHDTKTSAGKLWARGYAKAKKAATADRRANSADEKARSNLHAGSDIAAGLH